MPVGAPADGGVVIAEGDAVTAIARLRPDLTLSDWRALPAVMRSPTVVLAGPDDRVYARADGEDRYRIAVVSWIAGAVAQRLADVRIGSAADVRPRRQGERGIGTLP